MVNLGLYGKDIKKNVKLQNKLQTIYMFRLIMIQLELFYVVVIFF